MKTEETLRGIAKVAANILFIVMLPMLVLFMMIIMLAALVAKFLVYLYQEMIEALGPEQVEE